MKFKNLFIYLPSVNLSNLSSGNQIVVQGGISLGESFKNRVHFHFSGVVLKDPRANTGTR